MLKQDNKNDHQTHQTVKHHVGYNMVISVFFRILGDFHMNAFNNIFSYTAFLQKDVKVFLKITPLMSCSAFAMNNEEWNKMKLTLIFLNDHLIVQIYFIIQSDQNGVLMSPLNKRGHRPAQKKRAILRFHCVEGN